MQVRSLDNQLQPERLKVITQQVEEEQALLQSQTLLRLQQIHAADRQTHSPQVRRTHKVAAEDVSPYTPPPRNKSVSDHVSAGAGSSRCPRLDAPPDSHRPGANTNPAPPRHRGDHEPVRPHQLRVHVQTEPGHHRAGECVTRTPPAPGRRGRSPLSVLTRPSTTSNARRSGERARRSSGEPSSSAPPTSPWTPPAPTLTLTQRGRTVP